MVLHITLIEIKQELSTKIDTPFENLIGQIKW